MKKRFLKTFLLILIFLPFFFYTPNFLPYVNAYLDEDNPEYFENLMDEATFQDLGNGFFKDKNYVYAPLRIPGADPETFKTLKPATALHYRYVKDKNHVYFGTHKLEGIDPNDSTFDGISVRTKDIIYFRDIKLDVTDPQTYTASIRPQKFEFAQKWDTAQFFAKDKFNVYSVGGKITGSDGASFQFLGGGGNLYCEYGKDKNFVYYACSKEDTLADDDFTLVKLNEADPATFEPLIPMYFKDKNGVYFKGTKLKDSDPNSFVFIRVISGSYAKDRDSVYYNEKKMDADPKTFSLLDADPFNYSGYSKDKNHVFYNEIELEGFTPEQLQSIEPYGYSIGKTAVYLLGKKLEGADPKTFRLERYPFSRDENNVYLYEERIEGADMKSFSPLGETFFGYLAKDKNYIYLLDSEYDSYNNIFLSNIIRLEQMDTNTFELVPSIPPYAQGLYSNYSRDKNSVYYKTKKIDRADPLTFVSFTSANGRDKNSVYFKGKKLEIDAKSFHILDQYCGTPKKLLTGETHCDHYLIDKDYTYSFNGLPYKSLLDFLKDNPGAVAEVTEKLNRVFYDTPSDSELHRLAIKAKEAGWLDGYPNGNLEGESPVNRAEFTKMLVKAFQKAEADPSNESPIPDVPKEAWYAPTFYAALKLGAIHTYRDGTAQPFKSISKVEALKMALTILGKDYSSTLYQYKDTGRNQWYSGYTNFSKIHNLLPADGKGKLYPNQQLTRGEAVGLITRTMELK